MSARGRDKGGDHGEGETRPGGEAGDYGSVTAEFAVGLAAVVMVLAVLLVTVGVASARMRCLDGARAGARLAALGQSDGQIAVAVRHVAGSDASVTVMRNPPWVEVRVSLSAPGGWLTGGPIGVDGSATAWAEP